jgi:hypothetical protein
VQEDQNEVIPWCHENIPLDVLARRAKALGLAGIDLVEPGQWNILKKHGLICTMTPSHAIETGLNDPANHGHCLERIRAAIEVTADAGCVVNVAEVIAIDVPDRPGGLADVLDVLDTENLGIAYVYAFVHGRQDEHAAMIFRFDEPDRAVQVLAQHHIHAVPSADLFAALT